MSSVFVDYHNRRQGYTPQGPHLHDHRQSRPLSDHHRHMLEVESGISPDVIAARGYWTAYTAADIPDGFAEYQYRSWMFPILVIPQWNLAGRLFTYILRPDNPRRDQDGKCIKYDAQPDSPVGFDCPPSMVADLRDPSSTLYITEGSKKADAMASRGLLCISLNGVYGFMFRKLIVSELDEMNLDGRDVRLIFDDDVMTKAGPADALERLSSAIGKQRGGRVGKVLLCDPQNPEALPGAAKIGVDDYFVRGGRPDDLAALTTPWQSVRRPTNLREYADPYAEIARLQRLSSAQAQLIKNPYLKEKEKSIGFAIITQASAKKARGAVGADGQPRLQSSEIANDYRERPGKGESLSATNNDGTLPITKRSNVKPIIAKLVESGILSVSIEPTTRKHSTGDSYVDTDFVIDIDDPVTAITQLADYRSGKQRKPYTRQEPCSHCGEVHARTIETVRKTYCGTADDPGCGAQIDETTTTLTLPVPPASDPDATEEEREGLVLVTAIDPDNVPEKTGSTKKVEASNDVISSPSLSPSNYVSTKKVEPGFAPLVMGADHEPEPVAETLTPEPETGGRLNLDPESSALNTCIECKSPTSNTYRCDRCVEDAARRDAERRSA